MKTSYDKIESIIARSLLGHLSPDEEMLLEQWLSESAEHKQLYNKILQETDLSSSYKQYSVIDSVRAWKAFQKHVDTSRRLRKIWWSAAAILLPILVVSGLFLYRYSTSEQLQADGEICPGCSQATLVLNDGHTMVLEEDESQQITSGRSLVAVQKKGELSYLQMQEQVADQDTVVPDNTLQTKTGNEYRITLADGTRVHLNYNTKLTYPIAFGKSARVVYLDGEAYFDVAPDPNRPFYVVTRGVKVKQYGTSFNVNAYSTNETSVVLVKGSIGLVPDNNSNELLLKPGQRAVLNVQENNVSIDNVNVEAYTSWNSGYFYFEDESLEDIMQTLSHWYNIKVYFESENLKKLHFTGTLDRYSAINPILRAISRTVDVKIGIVKNTISIAN